MIKTELIDTHELIGVLILILGNLSLFIVKGSIGYMFGSLAVIADAYNSLFDTIYSIAFLIGFYYATQPPDPSHPLGHSRIKPLIGMSIACMIFFGGIRVVSRSINSLFHGPTVRFNLFLVVALLISVFGKLGMYLALNQGDFTESSPPFQAAAKDNLVDIFASLCAMVGVIGAQTYWILDSLMGGVVSIWIFKTGYDIANENFKYLIGAAPPQSLQTEIKEAIPQISALKGVHDILIYYAGTKVHVQAHIEVDAHVTLREAHSLEEQVENHILQLKQVSRAFLHIDPTAPKNLSE